MQTKKRFLEHRVIFHFCLLTYKIYVNFDRPISLRVAAAPKTKKGPTGLAITLRDRS